MSADPIHPLSTDESVPHWSQQWRWASRCFTTTYPGHLVPTCSNRKGTGSSPLLCSTFILTTFSTSEPPLQPHPDSTATMQNITEKRRRPKRDSSFLLSLARP